MTPDEEKENNVKKLIQT